LVYWGDGFWGWFAAAQSTVWPFVIAVFPTVFDKDLCLTQVVGEFTVQNLVSELDVEAIELAVHLI